MVPVLQGIDHVHVYVHDRAAAERWYAQALGLARSPGLEFWAADGGPLTLQDAGNTLHLALFERAPRPNRATIALRTTAAGLRAWQQHLATVPGVQVSVEDHEVSVSIYFSDPDGNPFEITTYEHQAYRAG